jgi:hypothetical protein
MKHSQCLVSTTLDGLVRDTSRSHNQINMVADLKGQIELLVCHFIFKEFIMFAIQPGHIIIIVLVALIFFAPSRLPMLVRGLKKMVSEFRDEVGDKGKKQNNGADVDKTVPPSKP